MQIQSSAIIEKFFVDSDLPDEAYNNQDFYMGSVLPDIFMTTSWI